MLNMPSGTSPGFVPLVGVHVPADEEAGPAKPGHRGGPEHWLVSLRHAGCHSQTHVRSKQPTAGQCTPHSVTTAAAFYCKPLSNHLDV